MTQQSKKSPNILSIDIGTSSVRAMVFDKNAGPVDGLSVQESYKIRVDADGTSEVDADFLVDLVSSCVDDILKKAASASVDITAVALSVFASTMVGIDKNDKPITTLTTYADTRSKDALDELRKKLEQIDAYDLTACPIHTAYWPGRFLWRKRIDAARYKNVKQWLSFSDYLFLKLFGSALTSLSVASWTGLLNRQSLTWDEKLLNILGIKAGSLARLTDASQSIQGLIKPFSARWPALADVPWFPAIGDGAAANIGSGCVSNKSIAVTIGTSSAVRTIPNHELKSIPQGLWCYRIDKNRPLLGGALTEGGNVFAWFNETFGIDEKGDLESAVARMAPASHDLVILPILAGERSPGWNPRMKGAIYGLSLATSPADILRACLEGVALRIGRIFQLIKPQVPDTARIVISGGALLKSPAWLRIVTDVLGRDVHVSPIEEASARGAAMLALESLGIIKNVSEIPVKYQSIIHPDMKNHQLYQKEMSKQQEFYEQLSKMKE
jgi:gluconokinase